MYIKKNTKNFLEIWKHLKQNLNFLEDPNRRKMIESLTKNFFIITYFTLSSCRKTHQPQVIFKFNLIPIKVSVGYGLKWCSKRDLKMVLSNINTDDCTQKMYKYVYIHGLVYTLLFYYSVSSQDLKAKKPWQQRSYPAPRV